MNCKEYIAWITSHNPEGPVSPEDRAAAHVHYWRCAKCQHWTDARRPDWGEVFRND